MKKIYLLATIFFISASRLLSQVAINTDGSAPHSSAVLDLQSASQGFLLPRVTTTQQKNIEGPASGLMVYNLDSNDIYFFNELYWLSMRNITDTIQKWSCGDSIIDKRDSKVYATVQIGNQCWMAENMNIGVMINGVSNQTENNIIEKYCYNDIESNCDIYGGLYQWAEAVQYLNGATNNTSWDPVPTGQVTGICPVGWHLPTDPELTDLTNYVSSQPAYLCDDNTNYIAKSLAATILWKTHTTTCYVGNNLSANNATGYSSLPGGYRQTGGTFSGLIDTMRWWSCTVAGSSNAWMRRMWYNGAHVGVYNDPRAYGYSIRCLKDN